MSENTRLDNLEEQDWFHRIMKSEGGFNPNEPKSVGGKSCAGIGQLPYEDWLSKKCQIQDAPRQVEQLLGTALGTEHEKKSPYDIPLGYDVRLDVIHAFYIDYFSLAKLEVVPVCLQYIHADFFVNSKFNANKILQRMVGFSDDIPGQVDGILGPNSRERIRNLAGIIDSTNDDDYIMEYHERKLAHYESIKETNPDLYNANIKGWKRRANHVLAELEDYFHDENPTVSAIHEDENDPISLFEDPENVEVSDDIKSEIISKVTEEMTKVLPEMIEVALKTVKEKHGTIR